MSGGLSNQISNVMGVVIPPPIRTQLHIRSKRNSAKKIDASSDIENRENILSRANKTCFVRLVSSVSVKDENITRYLNENLVILDESDADSFAKNFVLFGGSSAYNQNQQGKANYYLRSGQGLLGSYGTLGDFEINNFGYRPMPGITDVKVTTMGKLGSIRSATINIKVWNKAQLDIIDMLYFRLGFTMFLEWGHTVYFDNGEYDPDTNTSAIPKLQRAGELNLLDPFSTLSSNNTAITPTKEDLYRQIFTTIEDSSGNYDAMLGMVTKFNFSLNQEGGFDCVLELQALGTLADAMKINQSTSLPAILANEVERFVGIANQKLIEEKKKELEEERAKQLAEQQAKKDEEAKKIPKGQTVQEYLQSSGYSDGQINLASYHSYIRKDNQDKAFYPGYTPANAQNQTTIRNAQFYSSVFGGGFQIPNGASVEDVPNLNKAVLLGSDLTPVISNITLKKDVLKTSLNWFRRKSNLGFDYENYSIGEGMCPVTDRPQPYDRISTFVTEYNGTRIPGFIEFVSPYDETKNYTSDLNNDNTVARFSLFALEMAFGQSQATVKYDKFYKRNGTAKPAHINQNCLSYTGANVKFGIHKNTDDNPYCVVPQGDGSDVNFKITRNDQFAYEVAYFQFHGQIGIFLWDVEPNGDPFGAQAFPENYGKYITIEYILTVFDSGYIDNIDFVTGAAVISEEKLQKERQKLVDAVAEVPPIEDPASVTDQLTVSDVQAEESKKFKSGLEIFLRSIQLKALNNNIDTVQAGSPVRYTLLQKDSQGSWITKLFANGLFTDLIGKITGQDGNIDKTKVENIGKLTENLTGQDLLNAYAVRGFNHNLLKLRLDGKSELKTEEFPLVDFDAMFSSYVFPYKINQGIVKGVDFNYPVYIPFGLLLMAINHASTIYDSPAGESVDAKNQKPLVYLDFNPETSFCLSEPLHFTTNVFQCLIPFNGTDEAYKQLFDQTILDAAIKGSVSGSEPIKLFSPQNEDKVSGLLVEKHPFKVNDTPYKGKPLNILLNIDYLLNVCQNFATKDDSQSVYFKQFIDQLLTDINKSMGDINALRLAYDDYSNCYHISDDQFIPLDKSQQYVQSSNIGAVLPLYGAESIARSLELRTEISNKLSNMIAISANSDINTDISKDSSPIATYSRGLQDRYVKQKTSINSSKLNNSASIDLEGEVAALNQFNSIMKQNYSDRTATEDSVPVVTNYYIARMNKRKGQKAPTYASAIIPISINFTTDGIAGLSMGHAFMVPDSLLPFTYKRAPSGSIVGFTIMGLEHTINQNSWTTSIRANMTYLKDSEIFKLNKDEYNTSLFSGWNNPNAPNSSDPGSTGVTNTASGCKTAYKELPIETTYTPNTLSFDEAKNYLKSKYPAIGKAVFAILFAEAAKNKARTAFISAGGYNYAGVQTDNSRWGFSNFIGQFCRVDSGGRKRMFASFPDNNAFLDFMANRISKKGFTSDADQWTSTYINSWWSPNDKAKYTKGTEIYNDKLSIFRSAEKRYDV